MAGLTRAERLSAYISASARRRIDYAQGWDCAAGFVARWVEQERGVDGAALWRGCYRTAAEARRLVQAGGGLAALVGRGAQKVGLAGTLEPAAGDIAVLQTVTADGAQEVAAIRTAIGWAVLTPTGVAVGSWPVVAAWRV